MLYPERFERAQGLGPAFEHKVPNQPPSKVWHPCRERSTNANASSEVLIGSFQPRRGVDGVDDARKVDHTTLEEMRIRAVRSVQAGESPEVVARSMRINRRTIYGWLASIGEVAGER